MEGVCLHQRVFSRSPIAMAVFALSCKRLIDLEAGRRRVAVNAIAAVNRAKDLRIRERERGATQGTQKLEGEVTVSSGRLRGTSTGSPDATGTMRPESIRCGTASSGRRIVQEESRP